MASAAVKTAFEARIATWAHIGACPLVVANEESDSPRKTFVSIEYPVSNSERIGMGQPGYFRESGGVRVVINILKLTGADQALEWAAELAALFHEAEFDDVVTEVPSTPEFDQNNRNGPFYEVPFVVPYYFDYIK